MKTISSLLVAAFTMLLASSAWAALDIAATSSSTGALVREIAGEHANLTVLAPPDRDLHHLQARPSMIRALRGADLVVALGADLEVGWLPLAISQAANPKILPGNPGYFEAAAQVSLLDIGGPADRALGDVHPTGNPHVNMDPVRMAEVATALAERLARLDGEHAADYRARAQTFGRRVDERVATWHRRLANPPGVVSFHKDVIYLLERFDVPYWGTLEPVPGVPPTASHIRTLINELQGRSGLVLSTTYQPDQAPASIANALGWRQVRLPLEPPLDADGDGYLQHMQRWVDALAGGG
ncbi:metal ABC transporter substrate-binding protein [Thiococcus pfennigii]|uniref:metal ABC transporter substrate-binding protein n=1 Tax=Thiococcus pfennigii TaxID=1057 RepID=UPI001903A341|nr:metal ABC transporter substrate-binding protein [Thiococcus pfennigii]MBK1702389.1 zinc ABC transporter substrate-binding protein [Thiococcus pfennigii]MBK1730511.1 zinc ABC transporter substrate-binding protein [Thiococcus pfennigii]